MYTEAFRYHIRQNGVRLLKFDNLATVCTNPNHEHLPGIYSTEPIENAVIEFLHALDAECPDVFLMLYWGYSSPWWLLHGDTLFESGIDVEAANPSDLPAPYARDSVTQKLDQAQWHRQNVMTCRRWARIRWASGCPTGRGTARWQGAMEERVRDGHLPRQPAGPAVERHALALAAGTEADGRVHRAVEGPARVFRQSRASSSAIPGRTSRTATAAPTASGPSWLCTTPAGRTASLPLELEFRLGTAGRSGMGPLPLVSRSGETSRRGGQLRREGFHRPAPVRGRAAGGCAARAIAVLESRLRRRSRSRSVSPRRAVRSTSASPRTPRRPELESTGAWTVLQPAEMTSAGGATLSRAERRLDSGRREEPAIGHLHHQGRYRSGRHHGDPPGGDDRPEPALHGPRPGQQRQLRARRDLREGVAAGQPGGGRARAAPESRGRLLAEPIRGTGPSPPRSTAIQRPAGPFIRRKVSPHAAIFHTQKPIGFSGGTVLEFTLKQGWPPEHNLGRLRLSATTAKPPIAAPKPAEPRSVVVKGQVPASPHGGLLVVYAQIENGRHVGRRVCSRHASFRQGKAGRENRSLATGVGSGDLLGIRRRLGRRGEPSSGRRLQPRPWELKITSLADVDLQCGSYFLP